MEEGGGAERIVLFVCTSNTCRSPMAEAIAKHWFAERCGCRLDQLKSRGWDIRSGGLTDEVSRHDLLNRTPENFEGHTFVN